jgi:hypothetical protein
MITYHISEGVVGAVNLQLLESLLEGQLGAARTSLERREWSQLTQNLS